MSRLGRSVDRLRSIVSGTLHRTPARSPSAHGPDRRRLAAVVWLVLVSQVLVYPGVPAIVDALGAPAGINGVSGGMWFLTAEFAAFVAFAGVWGAVSDTLGRRASLVVVGALGGAVAYLTLALAPQLGIDFVTALLVRLVGGAFTIGAFSLGITMLMDLGGGHGRNMGAAGVAIGFGAALGSVVGGGLADVDPFYPIYASAGVLFLAALLAATVTDRAGNADPNAADDRGVTTVDEPDPAPADDPGFRDVLARIRSVPGLLVPFAFGFIDRLTAGFFALVGVYYFQEGAFELSAFGAGLTLALFFLPFAILQYPMGVLSDRIGRFLPVVVGSVAYGFVIIAVGLAPTYPIAAGLMVLVGVCGALVAPATMALVTDLVGVAERGAAMGLFNVFGSLGFLTGFLVGGTVTEGFDYLTAFLVVGGMEILIALALFPAVRSITGEVKSVG
ncbi:Major Facilitator Superfamily protein [Halopenitus malekzadehii]|uniref:Major Facilitator Superfamily protein n=1 Tax=Halopenitus malekzadehii TaxID=1267564 RepID=A0A1H6J959_9EURY|nr:MFS transporter [Halopenitus malekzadehii]SEH55478.1 Major Facilitator Superfamily protein [Halopenitus malekzadehii]